MRRRAVVALVGVCAAVGIGVVLLVAPPSRAGVSVPAATVSASAPPSQTTSARVIDSIPASPVGFVDGYDRDLFGQRWADVDRNGCDTRNDILGRDLLDVVIKPGTHGCKVLSGTLLDPYDGVAVAFVAGEHTSREVQIDHIVALGWAWQHGAAAWDGERRERFANDPENLLATTDAANAAKSDSGPGEWMPSTPEGRCAYVERFISVVVAYGLTIDETDRAALRTAQARC